MERPSFTHIVITIAQTAYVQLGVIEDPFSKKKQKDLAQAKFSIDLLDILKEKTKGNLAQEEQDLLDKVLYDLRMKYLYEVDNKNRH